MQATVRKEEMLLQLEVEPIDIRARLSKAKLESRTLANRSRPSSRYVYVVYVYVLRLMLRVFFSILLVSFFM